MKRYQYILFDWDGCLANTLQIWMSAYEKIYAEYGVFPSQQEIARHFGDWQAPTYFGIEKVDECFEKIDKLASADLKRVALNPGAKIVLETLRSRKKKMALLSSSLRNVIEDGLRHNKIEDYFDVVLSGEDVLKHKPDPEVIYKALDVLRGNKKQAVIIGDSRKDLGAAANAGIDSVLFYPDSNKLFYTIKELSQYNPTYTISKLPQLLDFAL